MKYSPQNRTAPINLRRNFPAGPRVNHEWKIADITQDDINFPNDFSVTCSRNEPTSTRSFNNNPPSKNTPMHQAQMSDAQMPILLDIDPKIRPTKRAYCFTSIARRSTNRCLSGGKIRFHLGSLAFELNLVWILWVRCFESNETRNTTVRYENVEICEENFHSCRYFWPKQEL